jgi:hypothetical protein
VLAIFILTRVSLALLLDYAIDKATRGTLGLSCRIGKSALNLTAGQAVLSDVALVSSSGTEIAVIGRAELELAWTQLPNLIVERLALEDVELTLKRDARGQFPALAGLIGAKGAPAPAPPASAGKPAAKAPSDGSLPVVLLRHMRIQHIKLHWEDETVNPVFRGDILLDARADEIATLPRPQPPSFSMRLVSPGLLDAFRLDVAGRTLDDDVRAFDLVLGAEAHPRALAPYIGDDVTICARTLGVAIEARANARPTYLDGGRFYTGDLTIERCAITADDDEVDLGRIVAVFPRLSKGRVEVSSLSVDRPRIQFGRLADGALRVLGFGLHPKPRAEAASEPPRAPSEPAPLPVIDVKEIALHDGSVHFRDEGATTPVTIDAALQARVHDVVLEHEGPGRKATLEASVGLPGIVDKIALSGTLVPTGSQREVVVNVAAQNIALSAIAPYLKRSGFEPDLKSGSAAAELRARATTTADGTLGFSAEITEARYADGSELMGCDAMRVEGGELRPGGGLTIGRVSVERPRIAARRLKGGAVSVAGVRTIPLEPGAPPKEEAPAEAPLATPAKPAAQSRVSIGEVSVTRGSVTWSDDALAKPVTFALEDGSFDLEGLTLGANAPRAASIRAGAKLTPDMGELSLEGTLVPDPGAPEVSGSLSAKDLSAKPLVGYLHSYSLDTYLQRGRFEAGLFAKARFEGAKLADARVLLSPISLKSGTNELGAIDSIELKGTSVDPIARATNVGDLTITGVRARAYRDPQGAIYVLGLKLLPKPPGASAAPPPAAAPAPPAQPPAPSATGATTRMGEVAVRNASFVWHDEQVQPPADVRLLHLDVTLGARQLGEDARPGDDRVPLKVHAEFDDDVGTFDLDAGLLFSSRAPAVNAKLHASELTLRALSPYLSSSGIVPQLQHGVLDARLEAQIVLDPGILATKAELDGLAYRDGDQEFLALDRAQVPFDVDNVEHAFHLGQVYVSGLRARAAKTPEGDLLFGGLRVKKSVEASAPPSPPASTAPVASSGTTAASKKAAPPTQFTLDGLHVSGVKLDWRDDESGGAKLELRDATVEVGPLKPGKKVVTPWTINADLANLGVLYLDGTASIQTRTVVDGVLRLTHMNGSDISPYLGRGTTLALEDGSFSAKLDYASEPAQAGGQKIDLAVTRVGLAEKSVTLFGWDSLKVDVGRSDAAAQVYVVDNVSLEGLRGEIVKLPGGVTRAFGLTLGPKPPAPPVAKSRPAVAPKSQEPPPLPSVTLQRLSLAAGKITMRDRAAPDSAQLEPYVFESLVLESGAPFVLKADDPTTAVLDLKLASHCPGIFDETLVTLRAIPFDAEPQLRLVLDLKGLSGSEIANRSPELAAKYDLSGLKHALAHAGLNFTVKTHGRIDTLGASQTPLALELGIDSLEMRSSPTGPLLLGLDDMRVDISGYDLSTGAAQIRKVEITNPTVVCSKEQAGFRMFDVIFKKPDPTAEPPPPAPAPDPNAPPPAPWSIEKLTMGDGEFVYHDMSLSPPVELQMSQWEVEVLGLTNAWRTTKRPMRISIRSRAGTYDDFKIKGQLALAPRLEGDLQVRCLQLRLDKISGYTTGDYGLDLKSGRLDIEGPWNFKQGHVTGIPTVVLFDPEVEDLDSDKETAALGVGGLKGKIDLLKNEEDNVELKDVKMEFDLDERLKLDKSKAPANFGVGQIVKQALGGALSGALGKIVPGSKPHPKKTDAEARKQQAIPFGPVETKLVESTHVELDALAQHLIDEPLYYVSLRGEVGRDDDRRARILASPSVDDRRDLIARLEAEHSGLERRHADAVAEVRAALQAGTSDLGIGRAHVTEVTSELRKLDRSLENLYEQEREGAERGADKRAREIETELCNARVEAVAAYLISKGAPPDRVKRRAPRLKPIDQDVGSVAIDAWTARRKSVEKAVEKSDEQKSGAK